VIASESIKSKVVIPTSTPQSYAEFDGIWTFSKGMFRICCSVFMLPQSYYKLLPINKLNTKLEVIATKAIVFTS
jgi:hypothetical protein